MCAKNGQTAKLAHPVASCGMCRINSNNNNGNKNNNNMQKTKHRNNNCSSKGSWQNRQKKKNAAKRLASILNVTQTAQTRGGRVGIVNRAARIPSVAVIENEDYELNIKAHNSSKAKRTAKHAEMLKKTS